MAKPVKAAAPPKPAQMYIELDREVRELMEHIKQREGIPYRFQLEHGLRLWAQSKGYAA